MTPHEAARWLDLSKACSRKWLIDPIHSTVCDLLAYKGGNEGHFVMMTREKDSTSLAGMLNAFVVTIGTYQDAIPHIGEAKMIKLGRKAFATPREAINWMYSKALVHPLIEHFAANDIDLADCWEDVQAEIIELQSEDRDGEPLDPPEVDPIDEYHRGIEGLTGSSSKPQRP